MTKQDQINLIREKCVEANPSIQDREYCCKYSTYDRRNFCDRCSEKPLGIHLADVLLALGSQSIVIGAEGQFRNYDDDCDDAPYWNLRADDLREQSDATVEFLHQLLQ
jgi:hypothetical protein